MKLKTKILILIIIIILLIISSFTLLSSQTSIESDFIDKGTSSDNNDNWINKNLNVSRNNEFTTLFGNSIYSMEYEANFTVYDNYTIEWDNHGTNNTFDYCIFSDINKTNDTVLSFDNLNMTEGHVKLIIKNKNITPYINGTMGKPLILNADPDNGLMFRFQINPNGSDISYNNFRIHKNI